jgi:hypothetical protein
MKVQGFIGDKPESFIGGEKRESGRGRGATFAQDLQAQRLGPN